MGQVPTIKRDIPLMIIAEHPEMYINVPEYQREPDIWDIAEKRSLVDTVLRQWPMLPLIGYRKGEKLYLLDGLQRITTLLEFMRNKFRTYRIPEFENLVSISTVIEPIEAGRTFKQMSDEHQETFRLYNIQIIEVDSSMKPEELAILFVYLNQGKSLSTGEKFSAYYSQSKDFALELTQHKYFSEMFQGNKHRKQAYQMAIYVLLMELWNFHGDLRRKYFLPLVTGRYDEKLTDAKKAEIYLKLDAVCHLFHGMHSFKMSELVPMYQSVCKLTAREINPFQVTAGTLKPWLENVRVNSGSTGTWSDKKTFNRLLDGAKQKNFWDEQEENMLQAFFEKSKTYTV